MDDSELVAAISSGDPRGLESAFRRYAGRLHAYARLLLGNPDAAVGVVQDTFLQARWHIEELRDPARLRSWLYAIARHECRRRPGGVTTPAQEISDEDAEPVAPQSQHVADVMRAAMGGLGPADREVAELAVRHGLSAEEIAGVLGVSNRRAHAQVTRALSRLGAALAVLLVAQAGDCPDLFQMLPDWDGRLTPALCERLDEHMATCESCTTTRLEQPSPTDLLSGYASLPFATPSTWLVANAVPDHEPRWDSADGFPREPHSVRRLAVTTSAGAVLLALLAGGTMAILGPPAAQTARQPIAPIAAPPGTQPVEEATTGAGSPSPSGVPSPPPSTRPTPRFTRSRAPGVSVGTFRVRAGASARCADGRFALGVVAWASADLAHATLMWRTVVPRTNKMTVSGRTAGVAVESTTAKREITWWVEVTAKDGRIARTPPVTTPDPCRWGG